LVFHSSAIPALKLCQSHSFIYTNFFVFDSPQLIASASRHDLHIALVVYVTLMRGSAVLCRRFSCKFCLKPAYFIDVLHLQDSSVRTRT